MKEKFDVPELEEFYKLNNLINSRNLNLLKLDSELYSEALIGKWQQLDYVSSTDSLIFYRKFNKKHKNNNFHVLDFISNDTCSCSMNIINGHDITSINCIVNFNTVNKYYFVKLKELNFKFSIKYISNEILVGVIKY